MSRYRNLRSVVYAGLMMTVALHVQAQSIEAPKLGLGRGVPHTSYAFDAGDLTENGRAVDAGRSNYVPADSDSDDDQPVVIPAPAPYSNADSREAAEDLDSEVNFTQHSQKIVQDPTRASVGTLTVNTAKRKLYYSFGDGQAVEYSIAVGKAGFSWKGEASVGRKALWPDWTPPPEMLERRPGLPDHMEGGLSNPLGARALYLFKGDKDTMFRIHGTNDPKSIGHAASSGCIRMYNADVIDLYDRVSKGAHVVVN